MFDIVTASYTMLADVYKQFDVQDENTGAIKREWQFHKTVPCYAKGIISNSSSSARSGDRQQFSAKYENVQIIEIRTTEKLSYREKITNIRTEHSKVIWTELDYPTDTPTVFEVIGTTPMTDPFGDVLAYSSSLKRSDNQQIGI
jgi:hypothetical protein